MKNKIKFSIALIIFISTFSNTMAGAMKPKTNPNSYTNAYRKPVVLKYRKNQQIVPSYKNNLPLENINKTEQSPFKKRKNNNQDEILEEMKKIYEENNKKETYNIIPHKEINYNKIKLKKLKNKIENMKKKTIT